MKPLPLSLRTSIRSRLFFSFLAMALLPALLISLTTVAFGVVSGQKKAFDQLESVKALQVMKIQTWVNSVQNETTFALSERYALDRARVALQLANDNYTYLYNREASRYRFQQFVSTSAYLTTLTLVDLRGNAILSTDSKLEGKNFSNEQFFIQGLTTPYLRILPDAHISQDGSVVTTLPVYDAKGNLLGTLVAFADPREVNASLSDNTGLGSSGVAYLVTDQYEIVSGSDLTRSFDAVHSAAIDAVIRSRQAGSATYEGPGGKRVLGIYTWVPDLQAALLVEQDMSEALDAIFSSLQVNLVITLVLFILGGAAALGITRSIFRPVENLVQTATQIASGNLEGVANVESEDEIGSLAKVFNIMTSRLRELINSLEDRVAERTNALQRRALQLETIAKMSREITSILQIEPLLARVVERIQKAFNFSHVNIFLVDFQTQQLKLFSSSGNEVLKNSVLEIDGVSLNAKAVRTNSPVKVPDVLLCPDYLADPGLPNSRSELIIPLHMGDKVIGTLDVHSAHPDAFSADDTLVLQSLGDQIAVAIENAWRYDSTRKLAIVEERERVSRDLHDSVIQSLYSLRLLAGGWQSVIGDPADLKTVNYFKAINQTIEEAFKEMRLVIQELRPQILEQEGLLGALHARLDAVEKRAGIETSLIADEYIELPSEVEKELFGIAQEALNNAFKHADATRVEIHIHSNESTLVMEITDNGKGFDPQNRQEPGGVGFKKYGGKS